MASPTVTCCGSDEEVNAAITSHERQEGTNYVVRKSKLSGLSRVQSIQSRVLFEDDGRSSVPVTYDGIPFLIISSDIRECQYGSIRGNTKEDTHNDDHDYGKVSRRHIQPTKKQNCQAKIKLRRIIKFPDYKIEGPSSKWKRMLLSKKLRAEFNADTQQRYCVLLQFVGSHNDHVTGKFSGYTNRLDRRVIENIKGLAKESIVNVSDVQRRTQQFSEDIAPEDSRHTDRRYFPHRKDVYNHIYNSLADTGSNRADQIKISECVDEWRGHAQEGDNIFFRPMSETDQLLFVYQTYFQKQLLRKYGQEDLSHISVSSDAPQQKRRIEEQDLSHISVSSDAPQQKRRIEEQSSAVHSFIKEILECDIETSECDDTSHGRHHKFTRDWNAYLRTERRRYMFGSHYFKAEILELILDNLRKHYLLFLLDPVRPATAARIMFVKGTPVHSKLAAILMAEKLLAPHYLTQVLLKDVLTFLVCVKTGMPMEAAEKMNLSTEVTKNTF